jgi:hypothetical protein
MTSLGVTKKQVNCEKRWQVYSFGWLFIYILRKSNGPPLLMTHLVNHLRPSAQNYPTLQQSKKNSRARRKHGTDCTFSPRWLRWLTSGLVTNRAVVIDDEATVLERSLRTFRRRGARGHTRAHGPPSRAGSLVPWYPSSRYRCSCTLRRAASPATEQDVQLDDRKRVISDPRRRELPRVAGWVCANSSWSRARCQTAVAQYSARVVSW